ncbi:MAG: hypothetical protein L3K26_16215 [Candidatus Hydrogenedentes bacterium]|nr:hypothetical protein [Candidatus Hydrogenedentota bacterium]
MLNIQIDNPELEESIQQCYGDDFESIAKAFFAFIQQERIKRDIGVSITQLDSGEGIPMRAVMQEIRAKYE